MDVEYVGTAIKMVNWRKQHRGIPHGSNFKQLRGIGVSGKTMDLFPGVISYNVVCVLYGKAKASINMKLDSLGIQVWTLKQK
jgi:hypothetical protein